MKKIVCDGNEACMHAAYLFTEVAGIYPITPSSPMPELADKWAKDGKKNIFNDIPKIIEMQSEAGAIGLVHGLLQTGMLASTYTASQGLLLMLPNMYKIAGEMLPCVIHVAARSLATHALSIFGDHQDIYATRMTGFCLLASSSVEDAYYLSLVAHLSSISSSLPFLHFFDGFRTSHELNVIDILENDDIKKIIPYADITKFKDKALNNESPVTRGTNQNADIYFQQVESRNRFYSQTTDIVNDYMNKINKLSGKNYKPFNYYGSKNAGKIIIAMGSVCETIKEVIDYLNEDVGLIEVHLYRPFSKDYLLNILPDTVKKIAVLDRTKEAGSEGEPLYLDVVSCLKGKNIKISHGRYGLSSKDTTPGMIKAVYDMLDNFQDEFTIGINDDITKLSLNYGNINVTNNNELLIYGYGSDGMISCSKSLLDIINKTGKYIQGYFEYDSKKSGGVTCSHLRFSESKIKSPYFVHNPKLIVISKDTYLSEFDAITMIKKDGILLVNTNKNESELLELLNPYKKILIEKNITLYSINADKIAMQNNIPRKISMIMEKAILDILNLDIDSSKYLEDYIIKKFAYKSKSISQNNINAIKETKIYKIKLDNKTSNLTFTSNNIYDAISHRLGNNLRTSDFIGFEDGTFKWQKKKNSNISDYTPKWLKENCSQCSMCSLVCPHGVIRPFLLNKDEYLKAPDYIKENCKPFLDYYFILALSAKNCTGCGVCIKTCLGIKNKALTLDKIDEKNDEIFDYLINNVSEKNIFKRETIKGSQLKTPKFAFHGACAGCGETAYIKLLTQLTDNLIIANATGCSSIYGGELPNVPYNVPWINSLFEDNAEFGYGLLLGFENGQNNVRKYMLNNENELFTKWLNNSNNYEITKEVYSKIDYNKHPKLKELKNYIISKNIWMIGGDGWAYDIGFSGIDHVLSSGSNVKILVLDTQVYSNTGGQTSKSTPISMVAKFASEGKKNYKKDLARIAMSYPNTYVAQISLGANMNQTIKALNEANKHQGPAIVIAYCPCISHGIKGGMSNAAEQQALATKCGYFPIFRYDGDILTLDCNPNFDLYDEFLNSQTRYSMLKTVNPKKADELLKLNKNQAIKRFEYYKKMN